MTGGVIAPQAMAKKIEVDVGGVAASDFETLRLQYWGVRKALDLLLGRVKQ